MSTVDAVELERFTSELLQAHSLDKKSSDLLAESLVRASVRGTDSHGIKLLDHYVKNMEAGGLRSTSYDAMAVQRPFPGVGIVDAEHGSGIVAGMKAVDVGMSIAEDQGIALMLVRNSTHPGAMSTFTTRAAERGYVAMAFTNTGPKMQSYGGTREFFGTNPIAFAAQTSSGDMISVDMATTAIAWNKVQQARKTGKSLPPSCTVDAKGQPTVYPIEAASLTPPGPAGAHKGYILAAMVEILCCTLTGSKHGYHTVEMYRDERSLTRERRLGQVYLVMRSDFVSESGVDGVLSSFGGRLQQLADEVRSEPPLDGRRVLMPGDPEVITAAFRTKHGIPLDPVTTADLQRHAEKHGIPLKLSVPSSKL